MGNLSDRQRVVLIAVFLAVITIAVYGQVYRHDFIDFDDDLYLTDNQHVQKGLSWTGVKWAFSTNEAYNYHPLTWISHAFDCQIYGLDPAGHHLTNVFLHIANTVLLFVVFSGMTGKLWSSAFVAGLFALHPVHVESVAWAAERKDVLSTFFWMLTMWFYLRYTRRPCLGRYLPVFFALALGLLAKQMLVTLPLVLLLLDYWPLERFGIGHQERRQRNRKAKTTLPSNSFARCFLEKLPFLFLSALASVIVYLVQAKATVVKSTFEIPMSYRLSNALVAYAKYIVKMFCPVRLGVLYPHSEASLPLWQILASIAMLLCLSVLAIRYCRSRRYLIVGWLWYLGTLIPVIGLVQVGLQSMADRYTYIPFIGLFIIVAWLGGDLLGRYRFGNFVLATGSVIVLSVLTVLTWLQLGHWTDSITLYEHTVAVTDNNDIMHSNLGQLYLQREKPDQAVKHWTKALQIRPDQVTIRKNLAVILARQGKIDQAIAHFREVLKYRPNDSDVSREIDRLLAQHKKTTAAQLYSKANILAGENKFEEAINCYNKVIQLQPDHALAYNNLGNVLFLQGKHGPALDNYSKALKLKPDYAPIYNNIGSVLSSQSKYEAALANFSKALELDPGFARAYYNMAVVFTRQGKKDLAITAYRQTLQIDPDYPQARGELDALLEKTKD